MEAVKAFNAELSSLYEVKPPISKAKMTALTRGAIKAIKFYKHVVQSVEKFILKCKPEYKVPGLYVIDSIVRQSRHQFSAEKDVFAPRFSKNLQQTFVNLFKCPAEDKSKIIRVLNLWQKNQVFPPEVIQPLFDFVDPNNPIHQQLQQPQQTPPPQTNGSQQIIRGSPALQKTPTKAAQPSSAPEQPAAANLTEPVLQQLQSLQRLLTKGTEPRAEQVHFDKKLLDFDYGEDEDEVHPSPRPPQQSAAADPLASLLTNPEVLRQLQTLQNTLAGAVTTSAESEMDRTRKLQEMKLQEDEFDKHLAVTVPNLPFASECDFKIATSQPTMIGGLQFIPPPDNLNPVFEMPSHDNNVFKSGNNDVEVINLDHEDSQSDDDDRYNKRKRSRSRSRDRGRDNRRRRSRSRSRSRRHRSKSKERKDKEKREKETERDKERKKRGLPVMKKDHLSVCSTTLWVGHLSKLVHQDDVSNTFGEFGDVVSIDLIIPRGCAFIVMHRRQDAARCLTKLKNHNLHGKAITLAWAPGKGVKGKDLKDYWEGDLGVSYIPYSKLKEDMDLEALEDGGMIDEESMPDWMKKKVNASMQILEPPPFMMAMGDTSNQSKIDTSQPPPMAQPSTLMQPPPMMPMFQLNNRFLGMIPNMPNMGNLSLGVPPPNIAPPNMLGLGLSSPFQGPPGFMPALPPPLHEAAKPTPPPIADAKLRHLSESLMNLAGQPLTMPPQALMNQPPPPLMEDSMDVEMEDAHMDLNKPPPLSEQLQASMSFNRDGGRRDSQRFSPPRRDRRDRSNERGRRRSRSRDRDQNRDRDRNRSSGRDRDRRDRDFGRGGRDRDSRDRRGGDRDRNRWGSRDDRERRDGPYGRFSSDRGRRDDSFDRREGGAAGRRDSDARDKGEREKSLNDKLKEMAGMKFEGPNNDKSPRGRQLSDSKEDAPKDGLSFEPPNNQEEPFRTPMEVARNPSPPSEFMNPENPNEPKLQENQIAEMPNEDSRNNPLPADEPPPDLAPQFNEEFGPDFGFNHPFNEGLYFDGPFRPPDRFDGPGPRFRDRGPPFEDEGFGPFPPDMRDFGPDFGFDGPPDRFMRGGRGRGRGRGRGWNRDGPGGFFPNDGPPPMMDEGFGPPMRDDFGPPMRDDFGPPMRDEFGPPPMRDDFGPPMRDEYEFGPPMRGDGRGMRMRGRGFFPRGGPRGRGGPPFRDGPPGGFIHEFDGPPDYFRGGPRGRPFGDFGRGRGRGFRGGRGGRPDFFDGPPEFFEGPPGAFEEGPPPLFEGPQFDVEGPPGGEMMGDFEGRRGGRGGRNRNRTSRWGGEEAGEDRADNANVGDGGATPLRDEIDDQTIESSETLPPVINLESQQDVCPPQQQDSFSAIKLDEFTTQMNFVPHQEENFDAPQEDVAQQHDFPPAQEQVAVIQEEVAQPDVVEQSDAEALQAE